MHHPSLAPRAARPPCRRLGHDHPQTVPTPAALDGAVEAACAQACRSFAPAWPLDQAIAVNPHWARIGRPVRQVAARLAVLAGVQVFPPRPLIAQAWAEGRITRRTCAPPWPRWATPRGPRPSACRRCRPRRTSRRCRCSSTCWTTTPSAMSA
jgi:hypothetical protein